MTCRFAPSRVSRGKNAQPWRWVIQRWMPRALAASTSRNEIVSISMSGSLPTRFGLAWWRVCLEVHHDRLMPTTPAASHRARRSLALPEAKICLCAASWARNATWVNRMPSAAAINNWNQLSPSRTNPVIAPAKPSARTTPTIA